jgi:Nif-specific regulatory protein
MKRWLIVVSGPKKGSVTPLTRRLTIGRAADNDIPLDDELASQHHCEILPGEPDGTVLQDGDTRNGTWVDGRLELRTVLKSGSYIKCGSTTFLYIEGELPENLDLLINEQTDRNRALETLRADYTVREQPVVFYRGAAQALVGSAEACNDATDAGDLQARLLDGSFEMIPAIRGAILLNSRHGRRDPQNFISRIYRRRNNDGPTRFTPSEKVLRQVYETGQPVINNEVTPTLCLPLRVSGAMRGVIYLEGVDPRRGFEPEHLLYAKGLAAFAGMAIRVADQHESMQDHIDVFERKLKSDYRMIGESKPVKAVQQQMMQVAPYDTAVLILGETGTGKELIAHGIHALSLRRNKPFVTVNCGSITESLLQSELFGHVKGGFTDASKDRKGKLELADGGTAFLDEVGELTPRMQQALLRVLQDHTFDPVGSQEPVEADLRIVAATNVDLEQAVRENRFRKDLFYRLNVFVIEVPPLRKRREDIPLLAAHFIQKLGKRRHISGIAADAMDALVSHSWPGNIRELENAIEAAIIRGKSETIGLKDLPEHVTAKKARPGPVDFKHLGSEAKRAAILKWREETGESVAEIANRFGITRQRVYQLLDQDFTDSMNPQ